MVTSSSSSRRADSKGSLDAFSLSRSICPYQISLFVSPLVGIRCLHWDNKQNIASEVIPFFSNHAQHILLFVLGRFGRWEISGHMAAILLGTASWICSKQQEPSSCSSYLAFSPSITSNSKWYIHTAVMARLQLGGIPDLIYLRDYLSIWSLTSW